MGELLPKNLADALADLEEKQGNTEWPRDRVINGYRLLCTCPACPEQYDVFDSAGKQVGYLRLRHGWFRADVPHAGGETVYESYPAGDGIFNDDERDQQLINAIEAIHGWWQSHESR